MDVMDVMDRVASGDLRNKNSNILCLLPLFGLFGHESHKIHYIHEVHEIIVNQITSAACSILFARKHLT